MKDRYPDKMIRGSAHKAGARMAGGRTVLECGACGREKHLRDKPCGNCGSPKTIARRKIG